MIRPPVPPVFFFIIDVSVQAVKTGMLFDLCNTIKYVIESDLMDPRTEIGFVTYDHQV